MLEWLSDIFKHFQFILVFDIDKFFVIWILTDFLIFAFEKDRSVAIGVVGSGGEVFVVEEIKVLGWCLIPWSISLYLLLLTIKWRQTTQQQRIMFWLLLHCWLLFNLFQDLRGSFSIIWDDQPRKKNVLFILCVDVAIIVLFVFHVVQWLNFEKVKNILSIFYF